MPAITVFRNAKGREHGPLLQPLSGTMKHERTFI